MAPVPIPTAVAVWRIQPELDRTSAVHATLAALLDAAHKTLKAPVPIRCQGIFLDTLSRTAHRELANSAGLRGPSLTPNAPEGDLLLCPKPHVAPGYADVVSLSHDCLSSALCHIRHLKLEPKLAPQRITTFKEITAALHAAGQIPNREQAVAIVTQHVEVITRRYAELVQPNLDKYRDWVRQELNVLDDVNDIDVEPLLNRAGLLKPEQWKTLALGRFLWEQIDLIHADNYAGPVLLFTGGLESAINASIYSLVPEDQWTKDNGEQLPRTLGPLGGCKGGKDYGDRNWRFLEALVVGGGYWDAQIPPHYNYTFSQWIDALAGIVKTRNDAAHQAMASGKAFRKLKAALFGDPQSGSLGLLNGLLLAWWSPDSSTPGAG